MLNSGKRVVLIYKYRIRFAKEENQSFLSHLDLIRAFERAARRGGVPLAYSEGFHPHPKLAFGPALAVGISSSDEYLDLELETSREPDELREIFNKALPEGLRLLAVRRAQQQLKPLNAVINRAAYQITLRIALNDAATVLQQLNALSAAPELPVIRKTKEGQKTVNIRPWLYSLIAALRPDSLLQIDVTGEIGSGGNLRPDEIIGFITAPVEVVRVLRTGLYHEEQGRMIGPFDLCNSFGGEYDQRDST
jgi:radical SAM-linked protein